MVVFRLRFPGDLEGHWYPSEAEVIGAGDSHGPTHGFNESLVEAHVAQGLTLWGETELVRFLFLAFHHVRAP